MSNRCIAVSDRLGLDLVLARVGTHLDAAEPVLVARAVRERHLRRIPVEARVVQVAHVHELAEDARPRTHLVVRDRVLALRDARDEVLHLVARLVEVFLELLKGRSINEMFNENGEYILRN